MNRHRFAAWRVGKGRHRRLLSDGGQIKENVEGCLQSGLPSRNARQQLKPQHVTSHRVINYYERLQ